MWYAVVFVCAFASGDPCDAEQARFKGHTDPVFESSDACFAAAIAHLEATAIPGLAEDQDYRVIIDCRQPGRPA